MSNSKIHPTAVIHPDAKIDSDCEIGPFCTIGKNVRMGKRNHLKSHVVLDNHTTVGDDNVFFPFAVCGAVPQDLKYRGEPTRLEIGNKNTIRESVTLNIGTEGGGGYSKIGDQNLLMAYVHLGHDVIIGSHNVIANSCQVAGHVIIEDWVVIGGITGVSQFVHVGSHAYVGGCSAVDRDVAPFSLGRGPTGDFEMLGMNLVGLKRRGFSSDAITALQDINRIFFKDKSLEKEAALKKIETEVTPHDVVTQFLKFVRSSEKGIYR